MRLQLSILILSCSLFSPASAMELKFDYSQGIAFNGVYACAVHAESAQGKGRVEVQKEEAGTFKGYFQLHGSKTKDQLDPAQAQLIFEQLKKDHPAHRNIKHAGKGSVERE